MKHTDHTQHSKALGRDMHVFVYGTSKGYPVLVFPTQDAMAGQYEEFGMVDELEELIDGGKIQLFCVDTIDAESWSDSEGDKESRAETQEQYYHFIVDEVVPFINKQNKSKRLPLATGCSMGATHSAIVALRRPDLFQGCIALSGCYDAKYFFGGWMNETLYDNSPVHFMENLPEDHPYVEILNNRDLVFCVGQGAWEEEGVRTTGLLKQYFDQKGIDTWCDFWGFDVTHDWAWWKKQITYFMPIVLEDIEKKEAEAAAVKKPAAPKKAAKTTASKTTAAKTTTSKATAAKATATKATATKTTAAKKPAAKTTAAKNPAAKTTAVKKTAAKASDTVAKATAVKATAAKATATAAKAAAATAKTPAAKATATTAAKVATAKAATATAKATAAQVTATAAKKTASKVAAKPTPKAAPKTKVASKDSEAKVTKIAPSKAVQEALSAKKTTTRSRKATKSE